MDRSCFEVVEHHVSNLAAQRPNASWCSRGPEAAGDAMFGLGTSTNGGGRHSAAVWLP